MNNDESLKKIFDKVNLLLSDLELGSSLTEGKEELTDEIINGLDTLKERYKEKISSIEDEENRLEQAMEAIVAIAQLDFSQRVPVTDKLDKLDALASGVNMLSEELQASIVSKEYLIGILNSMINTIIVIDTDGKIQMINKSLLNLLVYDEQDLIGESVEKILKDYNTFKEDLNNNFIDNQEKEFCTSDGRKIPVLFSASNIIGSGNIVCAAQDITDIKRSQERQEELLKELEKSNKELKDFAYIISHDLKAPLRAIATLADWIITDNKDVLNEDGQEQLDLLINRVKRMESLINGILVYSRLSNDQEVIAEVNLNDTMKELIDLLVVDDKIEVKLVNKLPVINIGKTRIFQLFQNLLSNAIKYMDKPKGIIEVGCNKDSKYHKFYVKDNGPGIEEKYFAKIFQIFQTLNPRDEIESTGIGLTIVKKIVEMYDGQLSVESTVGEGTTFFFTFPNTMIKG